MTFKRVASSSSALSQRKGSNSILSYRKLTLDRLTDPSSRFFTRTVAFSFNGATTWTSPRIGDSQGNIQINYLVVAGGGAGGASFAGGGGGGGVVSGSVIVPANTSYTLAIGAGGAYAAAAPGQNGATGANGSNSGIFNTTSGVALTTWAIGGGGGGGRSTSPGSGSDGMSGGSGGGSAGYASPSIPGITVYAGLGTPGQGYSGGTSSQSFTNNNGGGGDVTGDRWP